MPRDLPVDDFSRRHLLATAAKAFLGVSLLPVADVFAAPTAARAGKPSDSPGGSAKQVIYLFMQGAMSHLDTLDPKPGREAQGETAVIQTAVPGIQLAGNLPKLARQMKKIAIIRSLSTLTADHSQARYYMHTAYQQRATVKHPCLGAWAQKLLGKRNADLPDTALIGNAGQHPGAGFLDARHSPLPINDPSAGLQNSKSPKYLSHEQFKKRMSLTNSFDQRFRDKYKQRDVQAYTEFYREAIKLLDGKDIKAFDIAQEPEKTRAAYGANPFGQGCLLARRLVQHKVRFVEVQFGNWDTHVDNFDKMPDLAGVIDTAVDALLNDLEKLGLLPETLVVVATEFGRSPKINANRGRDHHPAAFLSLLAGGGVRGGQVYGASDQDGHSVEDNGVSVPNFNATLAHALGLSQDKEVLSNDGRPFTVADAGMPVLTLF